jgi:outer membrane protein assembly factor BamA
MDLAGAFVPVLRRLASLLLAAACAGAVLAAEAARITAIRFEGNRVTEERVILREMAVRVGDTSSPDALARSRQAILDLGLFREVEIDERAAEGGVEIVVRVREKRYVLPIPRGDANSDDDVVYGAELRWSNLFGLDHTFKGYVERGDYPNDRRRRDEEVVKLTYDVPYLGDSDLGLRVGLQHVDQTTPGDLGEYDETFRRFELLVTRDLRTTRPRHGWIVGGGIFVEDQTAEGEFAPPDDGRSTALVGIADYRDLRFNVYSETGRRFNARVEAAADGVGSDFGYTRTSVSYFESRALGSTPHQNLHLLANVGFVSGGPRSRNNYSLGGASQLRGYGSDFVEGDRFYHFAVEYLRPLRWPWLRLLLLAEVGGADDDIRGRSDGSPYANIGIGVRLRFTAFVDIEVEAGLALPLIDGDGPRFFASGN